MILRGQPLWDGSAANLQVTDASPRTMELRALVSARNASAAWDLRCVVREKLVAFLQNEMPEALPKERIVAPLHIPPAAVQDAEADRERPRERQRQRA